MADAAAPDDLKSDNSSHPSGIFVSDGAKNVAFDDDPAAILPEDPLPAFDYELIDEEQMARRVAPYDGSHVLVSDDETKPGVPAIYYVGRVRVGVIAKPFAGWLDPMSRRPIPFTPTCWRANPIWRA